MINKCNPSNTIITSIADFVDMDSNGNGVYPISSSEFQLDSSNEYLEIEVYKDSSCNKLITRQFVYPLMFAFN